MAEQDVDRQEEYQEEEEEKKFPVFIVPLIAGPVLLLVLIIALAGGTTETTDGPVEEVFDYEKLRNEADSCVQEASQLYYQARQLDDQKEKDKLLDKASTACEKAIQNFERIRTYHEKRGLKPKAGHRYEWDDAYQQASILQSDIIKEKGF